MAFSRSRASRLVDSDFYILSTAAALIFFQCLDHGLFLSSFQSVVLSAYLPVQSSRLYFCPSVASVVLSLFQCWTILCAQRVRRTSTGIIRSPRSSGSLRVCELLCCSLSLSPGTATFCCATCIQGAKVRWRGRWSRVSRSPLTIRIGRRNLPPRLLLGKKAVV